MSEKENKMELKCIEIQSKGEWPSYLLDDINYACCTLQSDGYIGCSHHGVYSTSLYHALESKLPDESETFRVFLKKNNIIQRFSSVITDENCFSLQGYFVSSNGFSGLEIDGLAIKIKGIVFHGLQGSVNG